MTEEPETPASSARRHEEGALTSALQLRAVRSLYRLAAVGGLFLLGTAIYSGAPWSAISPLIAGYPLLLWGSFTAKSRPATAAAGLSAFLVVFGIVVLVTMGLAPGAFVALACAVFLVALLIGRTYALGTLTVTGASILAIGIAHAYGWLPPPATDSFDPRRLDVWTRVTITHVLLSAIFTVSATGVMSAYRKTVRALVDANEALEREKGQKSAAEARERELHQRMQDTQRIEALGRLAAGVAHDFNNSLLVVQTWADVLAEKELQDRDVDDAVEAIREACVRSAELTRQLLAFGRQEPYAPRATDLLNVVARLKQTLARVLPRNIDLHVIEACVVEAAWTDPSQLEHVLMNLALNARDAMPEGGTLSFVLDRPDASELEDLPAGEYVALRVRDTGIGIPKHVLPHVFEPFFSTKGAGLGSGLGLSSAYGVIRAHGGQLIATSEPGHGATFTITLPGVPRSMGGVRPRMGHLVLTLVPHGDRRTEIAAALRKEGHRVQEASTPRQATELVRRARQRIGAMIVEGDTFGPEIAAVVDAFRAHFPAAPTILIGDSAGALILDGPTPGTRPSAAEDDSFVILPAHCEMSRLLGFLATRLDPGDAILFPACAPEPTYTHIDYGRHFQGARAALASVG